ncbi:unnamed protein product, partial [Mesorhabditis spiculigera]
MYPFNRLSTVNAGDERVLVQQRRSLVPKSFMANILEVGGYDVPDDERVARRGAAEGGGALFGSSSRGKYFALYTFAALIILLNCWLFKMNVWLMLFYQQQFGLMHTCTVSSIVSGIKPFVNAVVIALFIMHISAHYRLVNTVDTVDLCFRAAFHTTPPIRLYSLIFFFVSFAFFLGTFALFCVEFISFGSSLGTAADASFLIVPMLSLWNIVPLLYYDMYNRIVRWGKGFRMFKTN